jgi:RNA recognition motif-containing protein
MDHHKQYNMTNYNQYQKQSYNDFSGNQQNMHHYSTPKSDHILFAADLPEETTEEDIENFFKNYNCLFTKLIK